MKYLTLGTIKNLLKNIIKFIILKLPNKFEKIEYSQQLLDNLDKEISLIKIKKPIGIQGPYLEWYKFQLALKEQLNTINKKKKFLRSPTVMATMNEVFLKKLIYEYFFVRNWLKKNKFDYKYVLQENTIGCQVPFFLNLSTSGNLIHHIFHVVNFLNFLKINSISFDKVYEFGGGYGNMFRVLNRLGFNGKYIIEDFPLFSALQRFYLQSINLFSEENIQLGTNIIDPDLSKKSLYIATWSLSETDQSVRDKQEPIMNKCDFFLIGFRDNFEGFNNTKYFEKLASKRKDLICKIYPIQDIPNSYYFFAKPK